MNGNLLATKFSRSEAQVKRDFFCLLMKDDNAPLDVAYRVKIEKIIKEYYPIALYDIICEADWTATSIWEHDEDVQVKTGETVIQGEKKGLFHRPETRTYVSYDTDRVTVVDQVEGTSGHVNTKMISSAFYTGPKELEKMIVEWNKHYDDTEKVPVNENYFNAYRRIPETVPDSDATNSAKKKTMEDMQRIASKEVPGNRHENLSVECEIKQISRSTLFVGLYHILYEYNGVGYECFITGAAGADSANDYIMEAHPIDETIKAQEKNMNEEIKQNGIFSKKSLYLIAAYGLAWITIPATLHFLYSSIMSIISLDGPRFIFSFLLAILCGGIEVRFVSKFIAMHKKKMRAESQRNSFKGSNTYLKQQIFELIQDDSIPEDEKKATIEEWVKEQHESYEETNAEKNEVEDKEKEINKKRVKIAAKAVVLIVAGAVLLLIVRPAITYALAVHNIENGQYVKGYGRLKGIASFMEAEKYLNEYAPPDENMSYKVFLRGLELVDYFSSDEFEKEMSEAEKAKIEKSFGNDLSSVTVADSMSFS